ncbi:uncharacterized protein PAC_02156 [Phialocephala subalpina]|uniref:Zn(2)-C6 fungal-type domain-containing protein n=1 Tax=Phialocephala subalpina TaxID=576137 RepID=A0A1L7WHM5_9HELO|nr:uncharacterized protein PAC_02156 [Phialocephala subalpina]
MASGNGHDPDPIRRTRQACVNCRRKKSKCPGEKPQCSICKRLDQSCSYEAMEPPPRKRPRVEAEIVSSNGDEVSRRFGSIEQKLEELAASVQSAASRQCFRPRSHLRGAEYSNWNNVPGAVPNAPSRQENDLLRSLSGAETLPPAVVEDGVMTYFKCFHGQPYSLLCQKSLIGAHRPLNPIVLDPMLALSIRCSSHPFWADREKSKSWIRSLTVKSWQDLLQMYGEGHTGLHYLQGLCLLAQVDFADGRVQRAHTQVSLGIRIAQSAGYLSIDCDDGPKTGSEEAVRCTWTLFMLDRTFSITRAVSPVLTYKDFLLRKPESEKERSLKAATSIVSTNGRQAIEHSDEEQDIAALIIGVYTMWDDAIRYVFGTTSKSTTPPWQPGSELATIEYRFADFEPEFSTHRYREVNFPRRAIHEPLLRPYFASWLCFQLTYMSIQCCIHHPFIMFIKLKHVIRKVPPSFLQKSYKSSLIHSRWIIRFLDEMDEAGMMLYDPFIGYLTAIAATIQLEHTLSKHADVAAAARLSFRNAIRFLRKLSQYWDSIHELLGVVEELAARLRHRHTLYYSQDDYDGILPEVETERVGLAEDDATLMWKVFDYASMSASPNKRPRLHVDTSISPESNRHAEPATTVPDTAQRPATASLETPISTTGTTNLQMNNNLGFDNLESMDLSLFDQLPEDWAFTIDDWTLFGAPGSTYFYNEGP